MRALLARRFPDAEIETFDLSQSTDPLVEADLDRIDQGAAGRRLSAGHKFDLICSNGLLEIAPSLPSLLPMLVGMVADERVPRNRIS